MCELIHDLVAKWAENTPEADALLYKDQRISYRELHTSVAGIAAGLRSLGVNPGDRVAVYLPNLPANVLSLFGTSSAGLVFVPINPLLKPAQVAHILADCDARVLVTSNQRLVQLTGGLGKLPELMSVVVTDSELNCSTGVDFELLPWSELLERGLSAPTPISWKQPIDTDVAAILYTSGSTGKAKGVVLSHRNLVVGADSVARYLGNTQEDRLLAVLPLSFDYGLSQLTSAFGCGAAVAVLDYLLPRDVVNAVVKYRITGLAAVPPLWIQLAEMQWPPEAVETLRYLTNSGGAMPRSTTRRLREALPDTDIYLMYGLTEAFRSTYLPPSEVDKRPDSIGMPIPNAEIMVVREDGSECEVGEVGELVHRGSLVSLGYWNDQEKTARRFRPVPGQLAELTVPEIAVWSGDDVRRDEEGFLYFVRRKDEMIKTSGYRVSPSEVEDVLYASDSVREAVAVGLPHPTLGQAILALVVASRNADELEVLQHCQRELPNFMVPQGIQFVDALPRNQNGKFDRRQLVESFKDIFLV